jgi:flagellar motility protein MotE (MotC chaperone)
MEKNDNTDQINKVSKNPMQNSTNEIKKDPENLKEIMKKIEKEGEDNLKELYKQNNVNEVTLTNIMKNGEKEFVKRTGRRMTYGEMRQMYG